MMIVVSSALGSLLIINNDNEKENQINNDQGDSEISPQDLAVFENVIGNISNEYPNFYDLGDFVLATKYVDTPTSNNTEINLNDEQNPSELSIEEIITQQNSQQSNLNWEVAMIYKDNSLSCIPFSIEEKDITETQSAVEISYLVEEIEEQCNPEEREPLALFNLSGGRNQEFVFHLSIANDPLANLEDGETYTIDDNTRKTYNSIETNVDSFITVPADVNIFESNYVNGTWSYTVIGELDFCKEFDSREVISYEDKRIIVININPGNCENVDEIEEFTAIGEIQGEGTEDLSLIFVERNRPLLVDQI